MVSQPACAAAAAAAVLWNRHGASVITSIITATQHRATVTRIEGTQKGTYEIYLQLVHAGTLRENEGVIGRRGERKGKMGCGSVYAVFSCLQKEASCAISFSTQLIISRHVSKHS